MSTRPNCVSFVLRAAAILLVSLAAYAPAQAEQPEQGGAKIAPLLKRFYFEGAYKAPIEVTFYFSPDSPATAAMLSPLHQQLIDNFVSKGLLRINYKEISFNESAELYTTLLHCVPQEHYLPAVSTLSTLSRDPAKAKKLDSYIWQIWSSSNIDPEIATACMNAEPLNKWLRKEKAFSLEYLGLNKDTLPVYVFSKSPFRLDREATFADFRTVMQTLIQRAAPNK